MDIAVWLPPALSAAAAIIVCIANNVHQSRMTRDFLCFRIEKLEFEVNKLDGIPQSVEQLKEEVRKHNEVIERTYILEKEMNLVEEQIKVANHRVEDLEDEIKEVRHHA